MTNLTSEEKSQVLYSLSFRMDVIEDQIDNLYKIGGKCNLSRIEILIQKSAKISDIGFKIDKKHWSILRGVN